MTTAWRENEALVIEPGDPSAADIKIDPEFRSLVPAISDDERKQLEANIVECGGARDPLTVWLRGDDDEVLLDGHNRYEICTRLGLRFSYCHVEFGTRDEAADWIDRNQLGRRNLSKQDFKLLIGRRYNRAKKAEHDGGKGKGRSGGQTDRHSEKTSERIAREHGVGEATARRAGKFQAAAAELGIEQEIVAGEIKATAAEVVKAAASLPDKPTPDDVAQARESVKASGRKRPKGEQPDKPTAGESRRKNGRLATKVTLGLQTVRRAVETLGHSDSTYRDVALKELQRYAGYLSQMEFEPSATPEKSRPDDELRAAVAQRWETMRTWNKHWGIADMKDVRRFFLELIREEQKQFDK